METLYAFLVYVELIYVFIALLQSKIWVRCVKKKTEKIYNPKWNQRRLREVKRLCFSILKETFVARKSPSAVESIGRLPFRAFSMHLIIYCCCLLEEALK